MVSLCCKVCHLLQITAWCSIEQKEDIYFWRIWVVGILYLTQLTKQINHKLIYDKSKVIITHDFSPVGSSSFSQEMGIQNFEIVIIFPTLRQLKKNSLNPSLVGNQFVFLEFN